MKRFAASFVALGVLAGCGAAVTPAARQAPTTQARAAGAGGLISRMQEPFPGVVEAHYRGIDDALADRLLARHPKALTELCDQQVKFDGELDWDRRWFRTGPRAIYLTRGGKRYEVASEYSYGIWEQAIGKRVTAYVQVVEHEHPKADIRAFLAGVRYYD